MLPISPRYPEFLGVTQYELLPWYVQHFDILISSLHPSCSARLCLCADFKATWIYSSVAMLSAHPSRSERLWSRRCEPETVLVFFNKKGNNNKSYRLITHSPITSLPPRAPKPRTMQHYAAAAFNYTIHHASYLAAGLIECAAGGVANPAFPLLLCGVGWGGGVGVLTEMENCIREDAGMCGCVWGCMSECDPQKCINQNRWSSPTQIHSVAASAFLFLFSPPSKLTVRPSILIIFLLLLLLPGANLSGGPCIISSSGGCWKTGDKF